MRPETHSSETKMLRILSETRPKRSARVSTSRWSRDSHFLQDSSFTVTVSTESDE